MQKTRIIAILLAGGLSLGSMTSLPAYAGQPEETTATVAGSLIVYDSLSSLPGATLKVTQGYRSVTGGCSFELNVSGQANDGSIQVIRELSYDPASCTQSLAVAKYAKDEIPQDIKQALMDDLDRASEKGLEIESGIAQELASKSPPQPLPTQKASGAIILYKVTIRGMTKDPINLETTAAQMAFTWSASPTQVVSFSGTWATAQLSQTGWSRSGYSAWVERVSSVWAYGDTTASFKNPTFCPAITLGFGATTYTNHTKTRVNGYAGGQYAATAMMEKLGGCTNLLSTTYVVS